MFEITVQPENVDKIVDWLENRGGVAVWWSVNLSNPSASWFTPALNEDGTEYGKPNWQCAGKPDQIVTDAGNVGVVQYKEARRFHVGVRRGSQGLSWKVTDGGTRKIRRALAIESAKVPWEWQDYATYTFDYETQDAIILVPEKVIPLTELGREA